MKRVECNRVLVNHDEQLFFALCLEWWKSRCTFNRVCQCVPCFYRGVDKKYFIVFFFYSGQNKSQLIMLIPLKEATYCCRSIATCDLPHKRGFFKENEIKKGKNFMFFEQWRSVIIFGLRKWYCSDSFFYFCFNGFEKWLMCAGPVNPISGGGGVNLPPP